MHAMLTSSVPIIMHVTSIAIIVHSHPSPPSCIASLSHLSTCSPSLVLFTPTLLLYCVHLRWLLPSLEAPHTGHPTLGYCDQFVRAFLSWAFFGGGWTRECQREGYAVNDEGTVRCFRCCVRVSLDEPQVNLCGSTKSDGNERCCIPHMTIIAARGSSGEVCCVRADRHRSDVAFVPNKAMSYCLC